MFTYATVCSGVEGCSLALDGMGWQPIFFSEIEPFPCAVLKYHYPEVPNLGDMSKIRYEEKDGIITNGTTHVRFNGRLDLLAGGTPCQDFSVAGKRSGGAEGSGTRSSLMWEWLRLARELKPRVLFWENVVGTFSSNGGRDFHALVRAIDALGYVVSWRVLDAQFTRVDKWPMAIPQRRRRVWLVATSGTDVAGTAKILFEPHGIVGDHPPRRITREEIAPASQDGNRSDAPMDGLRKRVEGWFDNIRTGFPTTGDDVNHTVCTSSTYQGVIEEVEIKDNKGSWWDGKDASSTLTTGGHQQYMPDKDRFDAVIERITTTSYGIGHAGQGGSSITPSEEVQPTLTHDDYKGPFPVTITTVKCVDGYNFSQKADNEGLDSTN